MLDALFGGGAAWFTVPALLGTGVFLLKLVLMFMGSSDDLDVAAGAHAADLGHDTHSAHDHGLMAIASVQGVSAFLMGFGWAGLGAFQGFNLAVLPAMAIGVAGGLAMGALFLLLIRMTRTLHTSGNIDFSRAAGMEAETYATIPAKGDGKGQVRIVIAGRQRILNAVSTGPQLPTGTRVRVVETKPDNSLLVEPA